MCGISGIFRFDGQPVDVAVLKGMSEMLAHRGPDDSGVYVGGRIGLAHRRLSIIDLSPAGRQPMSNEGETLWLVFNGEIYNYRELRSRLVSKGYVFRSQTDSEVILHAYAEWGEACVEHMRGMWAFVIWDTKRSRLFGSRDRLGIKPLYYHRNERRLIFASEIKGLLAAADLTPQVNPSVLYRFVVHQVADCDDRTTFQDIHQLRAGHNFTVEQDGRLQFKKYWSPDDAAERNNSLTDDEYASQFKQLFEESVREHLQSDVPVGACLSGGLDSSSIVAVAAAELKTGMSTFSIAYPGTDMNEGPFIDAMHAAVPNLMMAQASPNGDDLLETLQRITWHFDEPVWGSASYSWWHLMKLVRHSGEKVLVNGQGADELLAGYPRYKPTYLRQLLGAGRLMGMCRESRMAAKYTGESRYKLLRETFRPLIPGALRLVKRAASLRTSGDDSVFTPDFCRAAKVDHPLERSTLWSLRKHLLSDLTSTRLPELLHAEDRFSMAFSIESRVPFLDHRLVEFAVKLPDRQLLRNGVTKFVLRRAMRDILPSKVLNRKDKKGYPTPADSWLRNSARGAAWEILASRSFKERGIFQPREIQRRFNSFLAGGPGGDDIWRWLSVESWFRTFIDKKPAAHLNPLSVEAS